jgi:DNA uptake protein ComE-like DNA-binding protein
MTRRIVMTICCLVLFTSGFFACSLNGHSNGNQSRSRESQDEKTRERVAQATEKAKEASKQLADKADQAAKDLAHKAQVVKEGVKEGWNQDVSGQVDLNSASEVELQNLPGIDREDAQKVIRGRPYTNKNDLVSKGIISKQEFDAIQSKITVK